jgi:hypothetical protein
VIWFWLATVLAVWTLIILTAVRWLQANKQAGERVDIAMAGPHIAEACEHGYHESCLKDWCACSCHYVELFFFPGRAVRPPSDPGDPP